MAWTTPTLVEICVGLEINGMAEVLAPVTEAQIADLAYFIARFR